MALQKLNYIHNNPVRTGLAFLNLNSMFTAVP